MRRSVFFVSDRTGITAEMLGQSLLSQFDEVDFHKLTMPFVDTPEKAAQVALEIRKHAVIDGCRPIVFSTLCNADLRELIHVPDAQIIDFLEVFIGPLEAELGVRSSHTVGKTHGIGNFDEYKQRIDAVNYALNHDDGLMPRDLNEADLILVGVSRCGKTPTCLYMALQFGIKAANYPLTPEDFGDHTLPRHLLPHRNKLFGLTIDPERLAAIRSERKPDSRYCTLENCIFEVAEAEALLRHVGVPYLNTTRLSIEELSTSIMHQAGLARRPHNT